MRSIVGVLVVVAVASPAAADVLTSALDQPLTEVSHAVDVSVADGVATYKVQRVFANAGTKADEVRLEIDLPYGGAATGLRIRAHERWYDGELMEAEQAAKLYQELTGRGRWAPKDPALLYWQWADKLRLRVFPVMAGGTSTVEYTLTVPTRYERGKVYLSYPRLSAEAAPNLAVPVFTVRPGWGDATTAVKIDGARKAPGAPIVLAMPVEPAWLAAIPHDDNASYVSSVVEIADAPAARKAFTKATLTLDLEHTYKGDLRIDLYTPAGEAVEVFDGSGGGTNDVRGAFPVDLPAKTTGVGTWRLVVSDHAALDAGTLTAWKLTLGDKAPVVVDASDLPLFIPDAPENESDGGVATIELAPPVIDAVANRYGRVVASKQHAFARLEVDAAPELRPLPKKPQVVFAIDGSHSMGVEGIAEQLALAQAYLTHVPDAEVEVVIYRRTATRLFGAFVPAAAVAARLAAARTAGRLDPGNGSALDDGARVAAAALATRRGALRLVLTTDNRLRGRFTNALALAGLAAAPAGAVVHVVEARGAGHAVELTRDDAHPLAPLALAHHGIGAVVDGLGAADKHLPARILGLVRPVRIDSFAITGLDLATGKYDQTIPATLDEGAGFRVVVAAATAPTQVELTGMIWGDKFRRVVGSDARFSKAAAAWVFSEDDHQDLSHDEMMTVAMMGRAVSPVTSYLAIEPGVRPSTVGLEEHGSGSGYGVGSGYGGMAGRALVKAPRPDPMTLLRAPAAACVAKHKPAAGWSVRLDLETTSHEVVDVIPGAGAEQPVGTCLTEAVWALQLPRSFDDERATYPLTFR
ncbi:MAG: proprotein convertase P-domain-containing protein [Myxococcales bacterium]|nr:proprotein convertase P-domain-containing protein [Myxococcales bacterium]